MDGAYRPNVVDAAQWDGPLGSFVVGCLERANPTGTAIAARYARALTRLSVWSVSQGVRSTSSWFWIPTTSSGSSSAVCTALGRERRIGRTFGVWGVS